MRINTGGDPGGVHFLHVLPHGAPVPRLRGILKGLFREIQKLLFRDKFGFSKTFPTISVARKCLIKLKMFDLVHNNSVKR
jgi:hypothetical protein